MKRSMPALFSTLCLALPAAAATSFPPASPAPLDAKVVSALRSQSDPQLELLRAGHTEAPQVIDADLAAELRAADASAADLLDLRAGEMSDEQIKWLVIGGVIVLALVIIF